MRRIELLWRMLIGSDSADILRRLERVEQRLDLIEQISAFRKVAGERERA